MSINLPTGDVEMHLARRIVALRPGDFALAGKRNVWTTFEPPPDGLVGLDATVIEHTTTRNPGSNTASYREHDLQILHRYDTAKGKAERARVGKAMRDLYDALHRCGEWTDVVENARYVECLALDGPLHLEDRYWALNVSLRRDG